MKVKEILSEAIKGSWKISNLVGYEKTFKDEDSPEAQKWMKNRDPKPEPRTKLSDYEKSRREFDKLAKRQQRESDKAKKAIRSDDAAIFRKVEQAVESMFDGVDPIDHLIPWMEKTGVTMEDIDRAVNKYQARGKKNYGMYDWMAEMWQDTANDRISDAESGGADDDSEFYRVEKNGTITKTKNPWKPT